MCRYGVLHSGLNKWFMLFVIFLQRAMYAVAVPVGGMRCSIFAAGM